MLDFNKTQNCAYELIKSDLRFLYTIIANQDICTSSYYVAFMPYMGLIIDGIENWIVSFNNSSKNKISAPVFDQEQQLFYTEMRQSIKMFETGYESLNNAFKVNYSKSDEYFSSLCKPIAKHLHLYDIYGEFRCNDIPCSNTILNQYCVPSFDFGKNDGERIKKCAYIGGQYISVFDALNAYPVDKSFFFETKDYGGFVKSPYGREYSSLFLLYTIQCQVNFVIYAVNAFIKCECSSKLRFAYMLYYYLLQILPQINKNLGTAFSMDTTYLSQPLRNAMAHYKVGVALKEIEIVDTDLMYGLTQKYLNMDYLITKDGIYKELTKLKEQISRYI